MARVPTLLMVSLLSAGAAFAQTAPPTQASIREVMNRVHGYLLTATPLRPINGDTGAAVSLNNMPRNVALGRTTCGSHVRMGRHVCRHAAAPRRSRATSATALM